MIELQLHDGGVKKVRHLAPEITIGEAAQVEEILSKIKKSLRKKVKLKGDELLDYQIQQTEQELDWFVDIVTLLSNMEREEVLKMNVEHIYEIIGVINIDSQEDEGHVTEFEFPLIGKKAYFELVQEHEKTSSLNVVKRNKLKKQLKEEATLWSIRPDVGNASVGFIIAGELLKKRISEAVNRQLTMIESLPEIISILAYRHGKEEWYNDIGEEELERRKEIFKDLDMETALGLATFFLRTQKASSKLLKSLYSQETPRTVSQFLQKRSPIKKSGDGT